MAENTSTVSIIKVQTKRRKSCVFLSEEQRAEVVALLDSGWTCRRIADKFNVSLPYISNIRRGAISRPESTPEEEWRDVPGWEGRYRVSTLGRLCHDVNSAGNPIYRILTPRPDSKGYQTVCLYSDAKRHDCKLHRLVTAAFVGPLPKGLEVNHIDGDKANNRADNLEYVTPSENAKHAWRTGLQPRSRAYRGQRPRLKGRKFTAEQVAEMKWQLTAGIDMGVLARHFNTTKTMIYNVKHDKTWFHVPWPQGPCSPLPLNPGAVLDDGRKRNAVGKYLPD